MELRLPPPGSIYFDQQIQTIARLAGCYARVKWATATQVRFTLVQRPMGSQYATASQHDAVIGAILKIAPKGVIRSARATYQGLIDFEKQTAPV